MHDLVIIGAGGSSRDIIELVEDINRASPRWRLVGLVDDDPEKLGHMICDVPVIGTLADAPGLNAHLIIGVASSRNRYARQQIADRLGVEPSRFPTLVHPTAAVSSRARIGHGSVLLHHVVVGPQATLGQHVLVCAATTIGHDASIGDCVSMAPHVGVSGGVTIGTCAYVGSGARFREGVRAGEGSLIGIGSVVLSDVEPGRTVMGNPARRFF